jgi:Flp pilus assembly protein TadG
MTRWKKFHREVTGTGLVEFGLSLFTIMTVLFGTIDLGRALYAYDWVSRASRLGTRFAMVRGTFCSGLSGGCPATADDVSTYVKSQAVGLDSNRITVTTLCYVTASVASNPPCAPAAAVQVKVQYGFKFSTGVLPLSWTMQAISQRVVMN